MTLSRRLREIGHIDAPGRWDKRAGNAAGRCLDSQAGHGAARRVISRQTRSLVYAAFAGPLLGSSAQGSPLLQQINGPLQPGLRCVHQGKARTLGTSIYRIYGRKQRSSRPWDPGACCRLCRLNAHHFSAHGMATPAGARTCELRQGKSSLMASWGPTAGVGRLFASGRRAGLNGFFFDDARKQSIGMGNFRRFTWGSNT